MTLAIRTERLLLRRFTTDDVGDLLVCVSDPAFARATPEIVPTKAGVRAHIDAQNRLEPFELDRCFDLAIEHRYDRTVIGLLSLVRKANEQAEIGYALGASYRGQGYATEATRALMAHVFAELDLHRVQATTGLANRGSWRVMERLGMRREGRLREAALSDGAWNDVLVYGILADEFRQHEPAQSAGSDK
jgi:RimJ/RimL family protein N-acetyltransferase